MEHRDIQKRFWASMTPAGLVAQLLERAVSHTGQAIHLLKAGQLEQTGRHLIDAQAILAELANMMHDEDEHTLIGQDILLLLEEELMLANLEKSLTRIQEAHLVLSRLHRVYLSIFEGR